VRQILWGIFDQDNHRSSIAITAESTYNNSNNYDNNNAPLDLVLLEDLAAHCPAFPPVNIPSLRADADLVDPDADLADQDAVPADPVDQDAVPVDLVDHSVLAVVLVDRVDPVDLDLVASVLVVLARRGSNWINSQRLPKKSRDAPTFWKSVSEPKYIPVQNRLCKFRILKKCV